MIEQSKGRDKTSLEIHKLPKEGWYWSIKYDGHYVQIHKRGKEVKFFTSGGKEFYLPEVAKELLQNDEDFILEAEYIGESFGKLGDRRKAAKLTTYRTEFSKGIVSKTNPSKDKFKVFDAINVWIPFIERLYFLKSLKLGSYLERVNYYPEVNLTDINSETFISLGFEGLFLKHKSHMYKPGKRQITAIKDKGNRLTADLRCIEVLYGEGKYSNLIGSLLLMDSKGMTVNVGSGMSDFDRSKPHEYYLNKIVEIKYEQIIDTYIQPIFIGVREDKTKED